ncbi:Nramp family divalent metal transporter [Paraburkholderia acidisoli]|uniref:Divalent metal cation transporter MntH n=1 Tax=Paraburkholderia acidisoli TaxID=2571748 RepID=A0A7Z2JGW4_9BURK|nr:Nramp family divalent metal transporter [Paraburkholderia acidisoli]QGZ63443.1 Mn(2+) uptake NRAMP transporter MntH [Paraburkholderia acidisoli]
MDHRSRIDEPDPTAEDTALDARDELSRNTVAAVREALDGRRRGIALLLPLAGPAVVVSVAYIDPGNFATNIQAGARYGYALLWVVLLANLIAMLFQGLSAKLGIATGSNLAQLCRERLPAPLVWVMWIVSEIAAMATDLAEFLGGAIGLALLCHLPLIAGMAITAVVTYALLFLQRRGFRPLELVIGALVGVIGVCYLIELFITPIAWPDLAHSLAMPRLPDADAVAIAVGVIGATVMPHALFLHSGLTQARVFARNDAERARLVKFSNIEVVVALSVAGLINMSMVMMASGAFHQGYADVAEIETAYHTLAPLLGAAAAGIFLVSLIASGISSSVVGTLAGQMIMQGFVRFHIPLWLRRAVTMVPSFVVVAMGVNATEALVASQVVLSLALPFPMAALVWFTCRRDVMGPHRNRLLTACCAVAGAAGVLALNAILLVQVAGMNLPGFG